MSLKQTLETSLYGYDPHEFFPIFYEGELMNKGEFVAYKAGKAAEVLGSASVQMTRGILTAGAVVLTHIAQNS